MRRIIFGVVALVVICGVGFAVLMGGTLVATQGVADAGEAFMTAIDEQRLDDAYDMVSSELQAEPEASRENFDAVFSGVDFESWTLDSRSVENNNGVNTGEVSGTAMVEGAEFAVMLSFIDKDGWKVLGYDFAPVAESEGTESGS